ncbi:hypothetical protein GJV26_22485 [Massilia dura]|uniref:Uncharacterized protein n=1 Tax=Pseudoduganella dura TaxID=321982 RepID=A0A6I3XL87_9BURK|nr:hypothetical protein [Pseudoduganella dura]MUI15213.1 hypothetical protein [Pseudoduganella dura]GGY06916.1 hypothetical protein GCM10007386_41920 [Pseudoduganella dura]
MISIPYMTLGLAFVAGVLAVLLCVMSSPTYLAVFVLTIASGVLAAASTVHFCRIRSPLMFVALLPGVFGVFAIADVFARLLAGVRLLDLLG